MFCVTLSHSLGGGGGTPGRGPLELALAEGPTPLLHPEPPSSGLF